jgi:hypothetical protein
MTGPRFLRGRWVAVTPQRRFAAALWALALIAWCTPLAAHAADGAGRRVLLVEQGRDPFLERVGAEIAAIGFVLVRAYTPDPLEVAARSSSAVVAIRVLPSRKGVEVWMADATSGRSLLRQVVVDERPGGPDRDLIALQTAELLRTSLLGEKPSREQPAPAPAAAQPAPPAPPAPSMTRAPREPVAADGADDADRADTALQVGFGTVYGSGGASPSAELSASLQHFFSRRLGFGLDFALPIVQGSLAGVEGSSTISATLAGAFLLLRLAPDAHSWFADAGAGGAFMLVHYAGETEDPLHASKGNHATAAAFLRADLGLAPTGWFHLGLRILAGSSFTRVRVEFAGNDAGSYGPLLLAGFALVGVDWR